MNIILTTLGALGMVGVFGFAELHGETRAWLRPRYPTQEEKIKLRRVHRSLGIAAVISATMAVVGIVGVNLV